MYRSSGGTVSSDANMTGKQQETPKEVELNVEIDPKDPKVNEAARIIQHAFRKHHEHQNSCHKHQCQNVSS